MVGGEIKVVMTLDDGDFTVRTMKAGRVVNELKRNIEQTAASTKALERHFTSFGQKFRDITFTISVARFALQDFHDIVLALPRSFIQSSAEIERTTKLLEGMSTALDKSRREAEAASNVKFVIDMAQNAPFQIQALTDTFVKLKSVGIDPTQGSMKTLVDSVARFGGTSEHLHRASIAIQQMVGKGVISMEELRQQLGEAVPDAMKAMAVGTGMSMAELVGHISKGEVEATSAIERMMAVLRVWNDDAAKEMMGTWMGQMEVLKTNWDLFGKQVGDSGLFETVKGQLEELNKWFKTEEASNFARKLSFAFSDMARAIGSTISFIYKYGEQIKTVAAALLAVWGFNTIRSGLKGLESAFGTFTSGYVANVKTVITAEKGKFAAIIASRRDEVMQSTALENKRLQDLQIAQSREIVGLQRTHAAKMAEVQRYHAMALAADRVATTGRLANGRFASAAEVAANAAAAKSYMDKSVAAQTAAGRISQAEVAARNQIALTNAAIANQTNVLTARVATATGIISRSIAGMSMLGRGALALLGGPIGAISLALTAGAMAWMEWGNKAAEAVRQARDALKNGGADATTVKTFSDKKKSLHEQETKLEAQLLRLQEKGADLALPNLSGMIATVKEKLDEVRQQIHSNDAELAAAENGYLKNWIDQGVRLNNSHIEAKLAKIKESTSQERYELEKAWEGRNKDAKEYADALNTIVSGGYSKQLQAMAESITRADNLIATSTGRQKKAYEAQKKALVEQYNEIANLSRQGAQIGTGPDLLKPKKDPVDKSGIAGTGDKDQSPLEKFLEKVYEDIARLKEAGDEVKSELAVFDQKVATGEFNYIKKDKGGKLIGTFAPTPEELGAARKALEEKAQLALKNKEIDKILSESVAARDKLGDMLRDADVKVQTAEEALNAGTNAGSSNRMTALKKQIAAIRETLEAAMWLDGPDADKAYAALVNLDKNMGKIFDAQAFEEEKNFILKLRQDTESALGQISDNAVDRENAAFNQKIQLLYREFQERLKVTKDAAALTKEYHDAAGRMAEAHARKIRSPMQALAEEWKNTTELMRQASVGWANRSLDALMNFTKTGKLEFGSLVESILDDLLRIQTQRAMADTVLPFLDNAATAAGNWMSGKMGGAGGGGGGGLFDSIAGMFGFANGGIMTEHGAVELRKYANGGIANKPQLALYGEGSTPEAFVPLPDGRTIPVTMQGGGGGAPGNVVVNVINQTSMAVNAKKSEPRFDGRQMVLDVVLTAASQPGPFREGLKGALT